MKTKTQGIDWSKPDLYEGIGRPDLKPKYKKPAGCFYKFTDYEKQFRYDMRASVTVHIDNVDTKAIKVKENDLYCGVYVNDKALLFFKNIAELNAFAGALTDKAARLRNVDDEIEARREMAAVREEPDGEY